jgi:hypothetical protein
MEELTPGRSDTWVETANCNGLFHLAPQTEEEKKRKKGKEHTPVRKKNQQKEGTFHFGARKKERKIRRNDTGKCGIVARI